MGKYGRYNRYVHTLYHRNGTVEDEQNYDLYYERIPDFWSLDNQNRTIGCVQLFRNTTLQGGLSARVWFHRDSLHAIAMQIRNSRHHFV